MNVAQVLEDRPLTKQHRSMPKPLRTFFDVAIILNLIGLACEAVAIFALHLGMPYLMPLLNESWAVDLTNYQRLFPFVHTGYFFQSIRGVTYEYPAPLALLYGFFLSFRNPVHALEWTLLLLFATAALGFRLHLRGKGLSATTAADVAVGALLL